MSRTVVMNNRFIPSDFLPIGFLGHLPYAAVPAGWLVCDGAVYSINDYPELAGKIGNTYGGDGVTTFAVPDERGLFRRGLDLGRGYDAGRVLGSEQGDDNKSHKHDVINDGSSGGLFGRFFYGDPGAGDYSSTNYTSLTGGTETRPKNRAYVPIIKAKNIYYDLSIQGGNAASLGGNPANYYAAVSQVAKLSDFIGTFAVNGYRKLPDGTILQWGTWSGNPAASGNNTISFPVVFPISCYFISGNNTVGAYVFTATSVSASSFNWGIIQTNTASWSTNSSAIYWLAIGK